MNNFRIDYLLIFWGIFVPKWSPYVAEASLGRGTILAPLFRCGGCRCDLRDAAVSERAVADWLVLRFACRPPVGPSRARVVRTGGRSTTPVVKGTVACS